MGTLKKICSIVLLVAAAVVAIQMCIQYLYAQNEVVWGYIDYLICVAVVLLVVFNFEYVNDTVEAEIKPWLAARASLFLSVAVALLFARNWTILLTAADPGDHATIDLLLWQFIDAVVVIVGATTGWRLFHASA